MMRRFAITRGFIFFVSVLLSAGCLSVSEGPTDSQVGEDQDPALAAGLALMERGSYSEAVASFERGLAEATLSAGERARVFHCLGRALIFAGRNDKAIESTQGALEWAARAHLPTEAASFEGELSLQKIYIQATSLRSDGDIAGSTLAFERAYESARRLESPPYQLKILGDWSLNYLRDKNSQEKYLALSFKALELARSLNYKLEASRASRRIGAYYAMKSDHPRALSFFLKALVDLDAPPDNSDRIACLNNISEMYLALGDYDKSTEYLLDAVSRIPAGSERVLETSMLVGLGNLFLALESRGQIENSLQKALDCFSSYLFSVNPTKGGFLRFEALAGIARVFIDRGLLEEAHRILVPALKEAKRSATDPLAMARILSTLGEWALQTGAINKAEDYYAEALSISKRNDNAFFAMSAASGLGRCGEAMNRFDQSVEFYNLALSAIDQGLSRIAGDVQRAEFVGRAREPFQALVRLYLELSKGEEGSVYGREVFRLSESMRARSYRQFRQGSYERPARVEQARRGAEEAKLNSERTELLKTISLGDQRREERTPIERRIVQIDDLLDLMVFNRDAAPDDPGSSPVPLAYFQDNIPDDHTAVLEYVLGDSRSAVICIGRTSFALIEMPPAAELTDSVIGFLSFLEDPSFAESDGLPAAQKLYRSLLAPAMALLPGGIDRLLIVPDGVLFRLPFEALALPEPGPAGPVFVNDRFTVSYAPSAASLARAGKTPSRLYEKTALAFGVSNRAASQSHSSRSMASSPAAILDDIYRRDGFSDAPLPFIEEEISDLASRIDRKKIDVYQGGDAAERTFKSLDLDAYQLIHLACHAFSGDGRPLRSSLLLSPDPDNQDDGFLQVSEMYGLRTKADLVVLSGCQTGRGKIVENGGNLGLPRAFLFVGARSVLATLWPISDESGSVFMRYFYDAYFRSEGKAKALQAAKAAMRKTKFAHPFFWASYVLTGEY
jgi:CHAT domain-containing protein/tetratricopeptide (TPR) repeat protein